MHTVVPVADALGRQLQGRLAGKKHFAHLCDRLSGIEPTTAVYLDFKGVDLVTGSWIHAALVPFYRWAADEQNDLFPILCKAEGDWIDDLRLVGDWTHQCYLLASGRVPARRAMLVGTLDPAQRITLKAVLEVGEVTGAELERKHGGEGIGATAWNNRLRDLYEKRLLRRSRRGREQLYSPVVAETVLDG